MEVVNHQEWAPPAARFTWELLCMSLLAAVFLTLVSAFLIAIARGREPGLVLSGVAFGMTLLTLKLFPWLAKRYRARRKRGFSLAGEVIANDPRPHVLYLRPFKDDESITHAVGLASVEQEMCMVLSEIGPLLIFAGPWKPTDAGVPHVPIPPEKCWQDEVLEQMSKARLVVMRIGDTPGFLWEMQEAFQRVRPERLVFWVPAGRERYEKFCRAAQGQLAHPLPAYEAGRWPRFSDHGGILYFGDDWSPRLQRFKTVWVRQTFWELFAATLKIALRPVYEKLGVVWRKPPIQPMQVLYILTLILLTALIVYCVWAMLYRLWEILSWLLSQR